MKFYVSIPVECLNGIDLSEHAFEWLPSAQFILVRRAQTSPATYRQLSPCLQPETFFSSPSTVTHFSGNRCQLRRSTQHLLGVYSLEFEIPGSFLDVDSSAARPGRAALE